MKFLFLSLSVLSIVGCGYIPKDMTDSKEVVNAGWSANHKYRAVQPLFLVKDEHNDKTFITRSNADHLSDFIGHQCGSTLVPRSIEDYLTSPDKWEHVVKVLPAGTEVRFDKAYHHGGPTAILYGRLFTLSLTATVLNDPDMEVSLHCISNVDADNQMYKRDELWLSE